MPGNRESNLGLLIITATIVALAVWIAVGVILVDREPTERSSPLLREDREVVGDRAQDLAAQSTLRDAVAAARGYFVDNDSYAGFDAAAGREMEPSLSWTNDRPATLNRISVNHADASSIVVSTLSGSGQPFCIRDVPRKGTDFGRVDAHVGRCKGPLWELLAREDLTYKGP